MARQVYGSTDISWERAYEPYAAYDPRWKGKEVWYKNEIAIILGRTILGCLVIQEERSDACILLPLEYCLDELKWLDGSVFGIEN